MSLKAKPQPTELDHIRDTLTGMIDTVGETRHDVKQLDAKVDNNHKELCSRLDQHDKRFDQQDKDNAEIKEMLSAILSRLPNN